MTENITEKIRLSKKKVRKHKHFLLKTYNFVQYKSNSIYTHKIQLSRAWI